ncbi:hypothetical protein INT44_002255 [Umbelopsis vinacea]|uniref:NTF2-related export protein n=1 Tax=Umbelopsis vinacea TaxID=44442 RepID=A0A8H7Q5N6_9FUNG|nr:hypothetical protein INT44_002255 [Umbelopsis vinacea]KAI9277959.1 hypothetical protein BC943DRAFT_332292 [Umbelopsis sp. AD052]
MTDLTSVIDVSARGAEQFVELYYKLYDSQRSLLQRFYRDDSAILWNGNAFPGIAQYNEFLNSLTNSSHDIQSFDCHPIPATMNSQGACGILVSVSGAVKYGDSPRKRLFSQAFMLIPDIEKSGTFYIQSENLR